MAYNFFMAGTKLPVSPSSFKITIPSNNETVTLIDDGEINILKQKGLKTFEFDMYLPTVKYPFAEYTSGYEVNGQRSDIIPPLEYLQILEQLKDSKLPFQFDVYRELPTGVQTWCTNETVSLEDYTVEENANNGFDVVVSVKLKQYKYYSTQKVILSEDGLTYSTVRETNKPYKRVIQCREGDTLVTVAQREFGYSTNEVIERLYNLNKSVLSGANADVDCFATTLHEGMTLRIAEG